ncbi:HNH endonuclease [Sneathiella sp.]|jgi:predicted HNH restriction endonuclease|uniref:HNH endonuclease n=1 Tax=Sneathiella sp. TaxID=1964365 RepID=UPI0039E31266
MEYSEAELVLPALTLLSEHTELSTTQMQPLLRAMLQPSGTDLMILSGRTDDRFSQKVRNLLGSHHTLENKGFAVKEGDKYIITELGKTYLHETAGTQEALSSQGFSAMQRSEIAEKDFENVVIEEGAVQITSIKTRQRSRLLIEYAKTHFSKQGVIQCVGCGFEGQSKYGEIGAGLIEFHHLEPLYLAGNDGTGNELSEAITKVVPLCPNCHRVVHRNKDTMLSIEQLQQLTQHDPSSHTSN